MRVTKFVSYFLLILLLGGVLLVAGDVSLAYSDKLCRGLVLADVEVGGLTVAEAEAKMAAALRDKESKPVARVLFENQQWEVSWDVVSGRPDLASMVRQAYTIGRVGNLLQRIRTQFITINGGKKNHLGLHADEVKIRSIVSAVADSVDRQAVDATLLETVDGIHISKDQTGRQTNREATVKALVQAIETGNAAGIPLIVMNMPASIRVQDLQGIDGMIAAYTTVYDSSDESRSRNIQIAASKLSGILVGPGDILSFNDRVGLRNPEHEYKLAPTLSSAGTVMDWGGGVCQVSSTLYNAALLADFAVVERSAHYQPPAYVPLGQDATVADGQIDLKVKNMRKHAMYVRSIADAGKLEVRIYGKREKGAFTVRIETTEKTVRVPQTIILQDPSLPLGEEVVESMGRTGFVVAVHRIRLQGEKELGREKISEDEFEGVDRILRVGARTVAGEVPK
ncbi:MAG: VanW family protein [Negativicutes bacterium]